MVDIGAFGGPALRAGVPPFHVMDVLSAAQARQRSHGDLVSLAAGQPSAAAPGAVRRAAKAALDEHTLGYTEQLGIPELREAVAGHYRRMYDVDVTAQDVVMTTGSSGGFLLSFLSAFDPGARVAMARPGYPAYRNLLKVLGCEVVEFATTVETNFQPTVDLLDELGPLDGLIVASPSNPTGTVLPPGELAAISGWCASHGVQLVSDEIYHGISYEKQLDCAWQYGREALVLGSFSKYFAMTGWRLGWMLVPQRLHRAVDVLTGNFTICPPAIAQHAAVAAFTPESYAEADAHVEHYRRNRDRLFAGLKKIGLDKLAPAEGAFYAYADVSAYTNDSLSWCQRLLADTGVAIAPGVDFDPVDGGKFVRFSFAGATEDVDEGVRRLGEWLR
ncbi:MULTISPECIES: aminotransferase class I/II-fold pyridoxal phosphate-dependent enzyme [unclassified Amycolatopsis]|uniref:aminotransferase class I/II-fold pyridoxal phosphate-dependent enzyme n=1 Tax=unclassified Amycolatopsis TaxID=2618356 RepID=UPI001C6A3C78|nr:aminotransferase class I/II-fold pyridoxal phosphate-dependent enzyme [Amycolatopsis sp. DSM 110486]QYN23908.1 aminotransferase class I/II-fold pyridoxal phosphate-dependent enzyme [Amycolatopsis sp. DSM 110486]